MLTLNNLTKDDNCLYRGKDIFFCFNSEIESFLIIENKVIVLLKYSKSSGSDNILCMSSDREKLWKAPIPHVLHEINYYTSIYVIDEKLFAYTINGIEYNLDINQGMVIKSELIK